MISAWQRLEGELLEAFDVLTLPLDEERLLLDIAAVAGRAPGAPPAPLTDREQLALSGYLLSCTGLNFEPNSPALRRGVKERMSSLRLQRCADYLAYLKDHGEDRYELQKLLQFLTVGETCFFRYPDQFAALAESISLLPSSRPLRIWSAGCSTGEEPYSIAMTIMETLPDWRARDIRVFATDINSRCLQRGRDGVYSPWSLRATGERHRSRYFERDGESFLVRDEVKQLVQFSQLNLASWGNRPLPELRELDAIFCRNVLIYFPEQAASALVGKLAAALGPSGLLFLGHSEALLQRSPLLEARRQGNSFFHVRSEESPEPLPTTLPPPLRAESAPPLEEARRLFNAGELRAAYRLLRALPAGSPEDTGALPLEGFVLAGMGRLPEAEEICSRIMALNDLLPEAYFLRGVLLDAAGRLAEAAEEYRKALLLDHDFIMPRYRMGRLQLRLGRNADAAREFRNSIRILDRQDEDGTIPYSGGLTRGACLAQLKSRLAQVA